MKVVIVMTYFQRQYQLNRTLLSIAQTKHDDFEVVIVDDNSPDDIVLPSLPYQATVLKTFNKSWTNPEPAYNIGIFYALLRNADIVILQNAENYQKGDIISEALRVTSTNYLAFGCYSLDEATTFSDHDIDAVIAANNSGAVCDGTNAWYNHSLHRPVGYDFCSAITADNIRRLNGYDERFSEGCAYGDNNLLSRIRKMGLVVEFVDSPFVVHQWHYNVARPDGHAERCERNRNLFFELDATDEIKAKHIYNGDF